MLKPDQICLSDGRIFLLTTWHFFFSLRRRNLSDPVLTFIDGTPDYLHLPTSACRISQVFPNAKLIIVLRDPVMRALSQWNMLRVIRGRERVSNFDLEVRKMGLFSH